MVGDGICVGVGGGYTEKKDLWGIKMLKKVFLCGRIRKPVVDGWRAVRSTILTEKHLPCTIESTTITVEIHTCFAINIFYVSGAVVNR